METFGQINLSTAKNKLNLPFLRKVKENFINEITEYVDSLQLDGGDSSFAHIKELKSFQTVSINKHLSNYCALKQYENTINHATLSYSPLHPGLADLIKFALLHAPDEWRISACLRDDFSLIQEYQNLEELDTYVNAQDIESMLRQQRREEQILFDWEKNLRSHYVVALRMNLQKAKEQLDFVKNIINDSKLPKNYPYVCAMQIVHLIRAFEFLFFNMGGNYNLAIFCDEVIHGLAESFARLKSLPETNTDVPRGCMGFVYSNSTSKPSLQDSFAESYPRLALHQSAAEL